MSNRLRYRMILLIGSFAAATAAGQGMSPAEREAETARLLAAPNRLEPSESVWIEELTYMEVRDRIAGGATTALVMTGGIEQNGPYLATGKHNVILRAICPAIVRALGNALCAPIVPFVPEGDLDPPSGHMVFPGSFGVREATYEALLEDIATSLKLAGFTDIAFLGDSGGNLDGMQAVTDRLNGGWQGTGVRLHHIESYYRPGWEDTERYTEEVLDIHQTRDDGHHDDMWVTAIMMVTDPESVRYRQRMKAGLASINGFDISDLDATVALGRKMVEFRANNAAAAIRNSIAESAGASDE